MSGAAGLSAAIRRRASNDNVNYQTNQNIQTNRNDNDNVKSNKNITINTVLEFHEHRLNALDLDNKVLKEQQLALDDNLTVLLETNTKKHNELESEILRLQNQRSHIDSVESNDSPEDIAYFKDKIISLEKQILELKTLVLKVQNYAMDSNLSKNSKINKKSLELLENNE